MDRFLMSIAGAPSFKAVNDNPPVLVDFRKDQVFYDAVIEAERREIEIILLDYADAMHRATTERQLWQITYDFSVRLQEVME